MGWIKPPHILLCATKPPVGGEVHEILAHAGHLIGCHTLDAAELEDLSNYDLVVLEGGHGGQEALQLCRRLRNRLSDVFVPILYLTDNHDPLARLTGLESGADTYLLRPFAPGELLAQVQAFVRLKRLHERLSAKTAEVHQANSRLHQAYQQIDQELDLARRIQQSLLPQTLPDMPPAHFGVYYRPCGRVGGDFYDGFRLDEDHIGFYVADVVGHGLPAGLLTIFLKKAVRAKEIDGRHYRLLPPNEVLQLLNREMIQQALAETPFVTMVYALFDRRDGTLTLSRAGHPYPIYLPRRREPELLNVHGPLLGVFETTFAVQRQRLQPGDKVLFYTDGLNASGEGQPQNSTERLLGALPQYRALPIRELVSRLSLDLLGQEGPMDDFTLLGMEVEGS